MKIVLPDFGVGDVVVFAAPDAQGKRVEFQGPIVSVLNGWVTVDVAGSEVVVPVEDCILVL